MPVVRGARAGRQHGIALAHILRVKAVVNFAAGLRAVTQVERLVEPRAHRRLRVESLRLLRGLGCDVDHAVHRIYAPERATRSADRLDALHVLENVILRFPEYAGKEWRVDRP